MMFIAGGVSSTARVHQYELRDKVDWRMAKTTTVRYARRELLGLAKPDVGAIAEVFSSYMQKG